MEYTADLPPETSASRRRCLAGRWPALSEQPWEDPQARRLLQRLRRPHTELLTFLDHPTVPCDHPHAERALRPAVLRRKNRYGHRSARGADAQAVLLSIFRTLQRRGHNPLRTLSQALAPYWKTGQLPPLPARGASDD